MWTDTKVDLAADIPANPMEMNIPITDQSYLRVGWTVRVSNEQMLIRQLIDNPSPTPDTMVVWRAWNGTYSAGHNAGTQIDGHTTTIDIYAQNVTDTDGLGLFDLYLTFPPETQYIKSSIETAWISSTGRDPWCEGPTQDGSTWHLVCYTVGDPLNPGHPHGPIGSGIIAKVTLLTPPDLGTTTVSLAGSALGDIVGYNLNAAVTNITIKTIDCPDVNLDAKITVADQLLVAKSKGARGVNSGGTLVSAMDTTTTQADISDQSLLQAGGTISIDSEVMTVGSLVEGTPDLMLVTRGLYLSTGKPHSAGDVIYRNTVASTFDGRLSYAPTRDPNHDLQISVADQLIIARVNGMFCPGP